MLHAFRDRQFYCFQPSEEELLLGGKVSGVAGFPDIADAAKDARHAASDSGMSGSGPWAPPTGSLLSDSASFSMSPIARDAASMHDAAAFFEGMGNAVLHVFSVHDS